MAARQIIVPGAMPSRDRNGRALPGKLRFYEQGTAFSTPAVVYTSSALDVAHDFPILSDAAGRWPAMWADEADVFDVAWSDQVSDAPQGQWTDLSPADDAVLASTDIAEAAADTAQEAQEAAEEAMRRAEAAAASVTGEPYATTSSTSNTIGTGAKTFVADQAGTFFYDGQYATVAVEGASENQMIARVDMATTNGEGKQVLVFDVISAVSPGGVGPYSAWQLSLASSSGVTSIAGLTGIVTDVNARAALDVMTTAEVTDLAAAFAVAL